MGGGKGSPPPTAAPLIATAGSGQTVSLPPSLPLSSLSLRLSFPVLGVVTVHPAPGDPDSPSPQNDAEIDVQDKAGRLQGAELGAPMNSGQHSGARASPVPHIIFTEWVVRPPRGCIRDNYGPRRLQLRRRSSISKNSSLSFEHLDLLKKDESFIFRFSSSKSQGFVQKQHFVLSVRLEKAAMLPQSLLCRGSGRSEMLSSAGAFQWQITLPSGHCIGSFVASSGLLTQPGDVAGGSLNCFPDVPVVPPFLTWITELGWSFPVG